MINLDSIPQEAFEELKGTTTADEVLDLAQRYGISLTRRQAEAAVGKDRADLPVGFGCGDKNTENKEPDHSCRHCKHCSLYSIYGIKCKVDEQRHDPELNCPDWEKR